MRIVSLLASATDMVFELGLFDFAFLVASLLLGLAIGPARIAPGPSLLVSSSGELPIDAVTAFFGARSFAIILHPTRSVAP